MVGDYAYVAAYDAGLRVISVADKSNLTEVGFFNTPGLAEDVHVVGDYAYVADWRGGLHIISVADKSSLIEVGFCEIPGRAVDVYVVRDYAYVAGAGLCIIRAYTMLC